MVILEVVEMEADILNSFKFMMGNPTTNTFLRQKYCENTTTFLNVTR